MSERRFRRTPGGVCSLGLHLVGCPRSRRRVLGGRVAARCGELLEQVAAEHGWEVVANEVMPDHVHLFVQVGPTDAPAAVVRALERRTALRCALSFRTAGRQSLGRRRISPPRSAASHSRRCAATASISGTRWPRCAALTCSVCAPRHASMSRWRRVWIHRELYNAALQERRDAWSHSKTGINYGDQSAQLTEIRSVRTDQAQWSFSSPAGTLRRLNKAFAGFFRRAKAPSPGEGGLSAV